MQEVRSRNVFWTEGLGLVKFEFKFEIWALAYTTIVRSKLEYSACVWDPHHQKDINTLEMVNRRAARVVYNKTWREKDVSPTQLLSDLGWKTLAQRRKEQRLIMMFKIHNGLVAVPPTQLQQPSVKTRGQTLKFRHLHASCDKVKHSYYHRTIPEWNQLGEQIVNAESLEIFKSKLQ